jgi:hypothetical protein
VVSDDLRVRMMKPRQPEIGVWKKNMSRKCRPEWRLTSSFLMEKYARERRESVFNRLGGYKRRRSSEHGYRYSMPFGSQHRLAQLAKRPDQSHELAHQGYPTRSRYPARIGYTTRGQNTRDIHDKRDRSSVLLENGRAIADPSMRSTQGM